MGKPELLLTRLRVVGSRVVPVQMAGDAADQGVGEVDLPESAWIRLAASGLVDAPREESEEEVVDAVIDTMVAPEAGIARNRCRVQGAANTLADAGEEGDDLGIRERGCLDDLATDHVPEVADEVRLHVAMADEVSDGPRVPADEQVGLPGVEQLAAPDLQLVEGAARLLGHQVARDESVRQRHVSRADRGAERPKAHRQQQPVPVDDAAAPPGKVLSCLAEVARRGACERHAVAPDVAVVAHVLDRSRPVLDCGDLVNHPVARALYGACQAPPDCKDTPKILLAETVA